MKNVDCVVIGAGVAGMTASIYLKRAGVDVLMLDQGVPGGQINRTSMIENYPGFKQIDGPTLALNMFDQTNALDIPYQYGTVESIENLGNEKIVHTDLEQIRAKAIIIASGRKPRELGLPNENSLVGHGISYCAYCDGMLYKDQDVVVVGGGNSALEEALYLADICKTVYLVHRRNTYRADDIFVQKIKKHPKIIEKLNTEVKEIREKEEKVSEISLTNGEVLSVTGVFIYIGQLPETSFIKDLCTLNDGYLVVNNHLETNIPGIYACGDVIKKDLYQISTAVGEGAIAASNIIKYLK